MDEAPGMLLGWPGFWFGDDARAVRHDEQQVVRERRTRLGNHHVHGRADQRTSVQRVDAERRDTNTIGPHKLKADGFAHDATAPRAQAMK